MYKIQKGSAKFLLGISEPEQLHEFLAKNLNLSGLGFVGRSNVGKSSLINALFGQKTARVSKTPGRTREVNIFEFYLTFEDKPITTNQKFYLFDLPGYGHAEVSKGMGKNWDQLMQIFFEFASPHLLLVNLQDARHPHTEIDQQFLKFVLPMAQQTFLALNKMDKLKTQKERSALEKLKPLISKTYKKIRFIHFISAETKHGIAPLEENLLRILSKVLTQSAQAPIVE